ncbi:hypothetical protein IMSAGC005_03965 [Lachnospiraceae bacterium]|nr:hypothetical protein IMSAGC005_03965 [Lachnospiraceae bacterium]
MEKVSKKKLENALQRALALEFVSDYCKENSISIDKLQNEEFYLMYNECLFAHPSDIEPNGLLNDLETLPKVTLVIKHEDNILSIEQTEYTQEFLSAD